MSRYGHDLLDVPFDVKSGERLGGVVVRFSDRPTEIAGVVRDANGTATSRPFIVAFAVDETLWTPRSRRIVVARPATDGQFVIRNLPPGDYCLALVDDVDPRRWPDFARLRRAAASATRVQVVEGGKVRQDLRVH